MGAKAKFRELCNIVAKELVDNHGFTRRKARLLSRTDQLRRSVLFDPQGWAGDDFYDFNVILSMGLPALDPGPPTELNWALSICAGNTGGPGKVRTMDLAPDSDVQELVDGVVWPVIELGIREFFEPCATPLDLYRRVAHDWAWLDRLGTWPSPFMVWPNVPITRLETAAVYAYALGLDDQVPALLARLPEEARKTGVEHLLPDILANIEKARQGEFLLKR